MIYRVIPGQYPNPSQTLNPRPLALATVKVTDPKRGLDDSYRGIILAPNCQTLGYKATKTGPRGGGYTHDQLTSRVFDCPFEAAAWLAS